MAISGILTLLRIVGAIVGIIGACRIYYLWSTGKQDIEREITLWVGGFVLLSLTLAYHEEFFGD